MTHAAQEMELAMIAMEPRIKFDLFPEFSSLIFSAYFQWMLEFGIPNVFPW